MNIKNILQSIKNTFNPPPELQDEVAIKFLHVLEKAREEDLPCDDMYLRLEEFVETQVQSKDAAKIMPLLREHLDMCTDCCEEYEALLTVLEKPKKQ